MKKLTILAAVLVLAIALTACAGEKAPEATETRRHGGCPGAGSLPWAECGLGTIQNLKSNGGT